MTYCPTWVCETQSHKHCYCYLKNISVPCAAHPWACSRCTKASVIFAGSITCFSMLFTSRTCLMCSQTASCQQLAHGQPCCTRDADRLHLPDYQQAQLSHWWVTGLDRSKVIACSYLNSSGLWNSIRPLCAVWCFHSWALGSTMGWLIGVSCLHVYVYRRGASSEFYICQQQCGAWQPPPLPISHPNQSLSGEHHGLGLRINLSVSNWASAGWAQPLRWMLLQPDMKIVQDYLLHQVRE